RSGRRSTGRRAGGAERSSRAAARSGPASSGAGVPGRRRGRRRGRLAGMFGPAAVRHPGKVYPDRRTGGTMPAGSSSKRERQYEHIKQGQKQRGASKGRAKEIASRTVNKERA